ncbi:vitamin D3 receptor-like [Asterias rubens]|uniref:vitamin D3 receptor-like n=1 Tax=Asterias rubens TaxID=7604 RepID=UPI001455801E|nr:vitamin D3 receptor-like [Asterias rubens]XP_033635977.1 vitamin D3 receptor-like [Asterias rubens]
MESTIAMPQAAESSDLKSSAQSTKDERLCLVCGDRANGVHYNVLSCEGCKSFFLRSTKSKATFVCNQGGKCSMDLYTRRHCPACRMTRCVELGMNVDRVWDDSRLKTRKQLIRVKRKKKQPSPNPKRSAAAASTVSPPSSTDTSAANSPPPGQSHPTCSFNMTPSMTSDMTPDIAAFMNTVMSPGIDQTSMQPSPMGQSEPQWELTAEQKSLLERLEKGYTASKEVFKNIFPRAPGSLAIPMSSMSANGSSISQLFATTSEEGSTTTAEETAPSQASTSCGSSASKNPLTGLMSLLPDGMTAEMALNALATGDLSIPAGLDLSSLPPGLSNIALGLMGAQNQAGTGETNSAGTSSDGEGKEPDAYQSVHRVTSFITNGSMKECAAQERPKLPIHKELLHTAMDMFAILVKQTIHFAKTIPGFMDLLCDDQAVLIKASIMDALLLRCAESYVPDMGCVFNEMTNDIFHINMMYQMGYTTLPEQAFQFMKETKECQLSTGEYALLNAVAILSPDRIELHNRELVEEIQFSVVETLHATTKVFHQEDKTLFAKLIMKLTKMRDIAVVHLSDLMEVQVQERDLSPLIIELFGLETSSTV